MEATLSGTLPIAASADRAAGLMLVPPNLIIGQTQLSVEEGSSAVTPSFPRLASPPRLSLVCMSILFPNDLDNPFLIGPLAAWLQVFSLEARTVPVVRPLCVRMQVVGGTTLTLIPREDTVLMTAAQLAVRAILIPCLSPPDRQLVKGPVPVRTSLLPPAGMNRSLSVPLVELEFPDEL